MGEHLRFLLALFFGFTSCITFSQEKTQFINGKVTSLNNDVSNVLVINLDSKKTTITNSLGLFIIEAKLSDSIRFTAVQYLTKEIIITNTIFSQKFVSVNLVENVINLNEVIVMPYNLTGKIEQDIKRLYVEPVVTSSSLGLPNADVKVLTQSERLLFEANRGEFTKGGIRLDTLFVFPIINVYMDINLHKTLNFISGRTKTLKDAVSREENTKMENKIVKMFSKTTMSEAFGISQNNIDSFLSFCLAQPDFLKMEEVENTIQIWEYLKSKSYEFKKTNKLD
ncbi:MAG: hypothetical protein ABJN84_10680 [Flavobacteriaceae bacterium]